MKAEWMLPDNPANGLLMPGRLFDLLRFPALTSARHLLCRR